MKFQPVSQEEAALLLPSGEYDAVVVAAVEKTSKANNPMIELTLTVYGDREVTVKDWLLSDLKGQWKLQCFCKSAGIFDAYQRGEISDAVCKDQNVRVKLGEQPADGDFPPRNKIVAYLPRKRQVESGTIPGVPAAQTRAANKAKPDDDIPF